MNINDYPRFTIIMRGYTYTQADAVLQAMTGLEDQFAIEMTLNTEDAFHHIKQLNEKYGNRILIGAGTVRTLGEAQQAVGAGAKFLLGPHVFTKEILDFTKANDVLAIPGAMTPSEVAEMFRNGADIVKVFPASVVTPRFFKDIQAPLGKLPLMGVGGISSENAQDFLNQGASYLGIGSGLFAKQDIEQAAVQQLAQSLRKFLTVVEGGIPDGLAFK